MDRDELKGKVKEGVGNVQNKAGEATGDREMESRGEANQAEGKAQGALGKVKDAVGDAVDSVKDAAKH